MNRMVNPDDTENRPVSDLEIPEDGVTVYMKKKYGFIRVFHTVNKDRKIEVANQIKKKTVHNAKWEIVKSAIADYLAHPECRSIFFEGVCVSPMGLHEIGVPNIFCHPPWIFWIAYQRSSFVHC